MTPIGEKDLRILRDLAKKQAEMARSPRMDELRRDWRLHGEFNKSSRPMVLVETGTFADDVLPQLLECEGGDARKLERRLRENMINHERFGDDTVVCDYLPETPRWYFIPFGIDIKSVNATDSAGRRSLGHRFITPVGDLAEDFHKLGKSRFGIDRERSRYSDFVNEAVGDILPSRPIGGGLYAGLTMGIVHIMKMEDMFTAMYDYPGLFHKMMEMLTSDYLEFFDLLEAEKAILPTFDECRVAQGAYCYTDELPRTGEGLKTSQVWGYMDSQESSGISPEMFAEFIAPYYRRISGRYGLFSYGCCEAVHPVWDCFLADLPNLRKVSVSMWCDEEFIGERLRGRKTAYLRKPSPNLLSMGTELDEDEVARQTDKTVAAARGCSLEIITRDVYRINNTWEKVRRYVELTRKCCEKHVN